MSSIGDVTPFRESSRRPLFRSHTNAFVAPRGEPVCASATCELEVDPAAATREPSGLTAIAAVAGVRIVRTSREALIASWRASTASGSGAPCTCASSTAAVPSRMLSSGSVSRFASDAAASWRAEAIAGLALRALALVEGVKRETARDKAGDRKHGHERPQAVEGAPLELSLPGTSRCVLLRAVPLLRRRSRPETSARSR